MIYDEDRILITVQNPFEHDDYTKLLDYDLVVKLKPTLNVFDVIKNRWGEDFRNAPLALLDCFLESPDACWSKIIEVYEN